jgi:PAS domain S-box-containing protein
VPPNATNPDSTGAAPRDSADRRYRRLFDRSSLGFLHFDARGVVVDHNDRVNEITGAPPGAYLGFSLLGHPNRGREFQEMVSWTLAGQTGWREMEHVSLLTGKRVHVRVTFSPVCDDDGDVTGGVAVIEDISDQARARQGRQRAVQYLQDVIDSMPSAIVGVDAAGRVSLWNAAAGRLTGCDAAEVEGRPIGEAIPAVGAIVDRLAPALAGEGPVRLEHVRLPLGGSERLYDVLAVPLTGGLYAGAVIRLEDVTDRVRLMERVVAGERMQSIGHLASGAAHELNNPLAGILQGAQTLARRCLEDLPGNRRVAEEVGVELERVVEYLRRREVPGFLEGIAESGRKAADVVRKLSTFARRQRRDVEQCDVRDLLEEAVTGLTGLDAWRGLRSSRRIEIERDLAGDLGAIHCVRGDLIEAIQALLCNAGEAIDAAGRSGGRIVLSAGASGRGVRLVVRDDGGGVAPSVRGRELEPFVTTKEIGEGSGLGLSVAYFVVAHGHGGSMELESLPGRGTSCVIHLPRGDSMEDGE